MTAVTDSVAIAPGAGPARPAHVPAGLGPWVRGQVLNVARHSAALRPFTRTEFGTDAASPSEGHVRSVNALLDSLRPHLRVHVRRLVRAQGLARSGHTEALAALVTGKERSHDHVRAIERIWDFYFELFGQRQTRFAPWLLGCDRIALDCYRAAYMNIRVVRPVPAPPPFSYMRTGFSPATFRRGIRLTRLGRQFNPFPLIQLPYHRLVNPWTLGAVLHEVSHNLQNDLGLQRAVPLRIARRLLRDGHSRATAMTWTRWNRESFADLSGLLLGGPCVVASLMDVVGRSPRATLTFLPRAVHPTPYLRVLLSIELLRRMGFEEEAASYRRTWTRVYPDPGASNVPPEFLAAADRAIASVVDAVCFRPFRELGGKSLAEVFTFGPHVQAMTEEAAGRLARGTDPGVVPERLLIGAARLAFDRQLASPDVIAHNFYEELARR